MVRLVVVAVVMALVGVLTPAGHSVVDCLTTPHKSSSKGGGQEPVKQEPKKDDLPRKSGEKNKDSLRLVPARRAAEQRPARSWTHLPAPDRSSRPAAPDDAGRVEHLLELTRPAVLQVFRN